MNLVPRYINEEICIKCGGSCCKRHPCGFIPSDLLERLDKGADEKLTKEEIEDFLLLGYACVDDYYWFSEHNISFCTNHFFIRMRGIVIDYHNEEPMDPNEERVIWDETMVVEPTTGNSFPGRCCALTDTGCRFSEEDRPYEGYVLIPQEDFKCNSSCGKRELSLAWVEYRDILEQLFFKYRVLPGQENN